MLKLLKNIIIILCFSCLLLGFTKDAIMIEEKDVQDYEEEKNIDVLQKHIVNDNTIMLYESKGQYVIDYCYKDSKEKSINLICS